MVNVRLFTFRWWRKGKRKGRWQWSVRDNEWQWIQCNSSSPISTLFWTPNHGMIPLQLSTSDALVLVTSTVNSKLLPFSLRSKLSLCAWIWFVWFALLLCSYRNELRTGFVYVCVSCRLVSSSLACVLLHSIYYSREYAFKNERDRERDEPITLPAPAYIRYGL